jgi:hypothetical protein
MDRTRSAAARNPLLAVALVVAAMAVALRAMGRVWWCQVGDWAPWSFDIWSPHNSQHLLDPYTFTHVLHGVVFYGLLRLVLGREWGWWRLVLALAAEAAWEVGENTPAVIEAYRESTISLDYYGDSILNSVADVAACAAGFLLAARLPAWATWAGFFGTELILALWIRDSLLLNVLMLTFPVEAVKQWQLGAG